MRSETPTVVVLGTGAVSGFYGGLLANAGYDVTFLARSDYTVLRAEGLRVHSPKGDFRVHPVQVVDSPGRLPQADLVLVGWKATGNASLKPALEAACTDQTTVLVLQNGWEVEAEAAEVVGEERVLGGCCFLCCHREAPGQIRHLDYGAITFGEYAASMVGQITERVNRVAAWLQSAGIDARPCQSLPLARWKKLTWNIPFNGLSVVLQADTRTLVNDPHTRPLVMDLMREVQQAARAAAGVEIDDAHLNKMMTDTEKMVPYASSMLLDYRYRRPMEVEAIFGRPVRAAIRGGFRPRKIEMLYHQLAFLDRQNLAADSASSHQAPRPARA